MGSGLPLAEHSKKTQLRIPHVPEDSKYIGGDIFSGQLVRFQVLLLV